MYDFQKKLPRMNNLFTFKTVLYRNINLIVEKFMSVRTLLQHSYLVKHTYTSYIPESKITKYIQKKILNLKNVSAG